MYHPRLKYTALFVEVTGDPVMVVDKGKIELKIEDVRLQLDSSERDQKPDMTILLSPEIDSETAIRCFELAIREVQKHGTFTMKQLLARDLKVSQVAKPSFDSNLDAALRGK